MTHQYGVLTLAVAESTGEDPAAVERTIRNEDAHWAEDPKRVWYTKPSANMRHLPEIKPIYDRIWQERYGDAPEF
jgi:hypothetical protein